MKDKDKLILVFYINVNNINSIFIPEYLDDFSKSYEFDDSIIRFIIPVIESETRVQCINPILLDEEQYKQFMEELKKFETIINNLKNN